MAGFTVKRPRLIYHYFVAYETVDEIGYFGISTPTRISKIAHVVGISKFKMEEWRANGKTANQMAITNFKLLRISIEWS